MNSTPLPPDRIAASPQGWQVIACDLDGTLLNRTHQITAEDLAALRRAREAGLHVAIATGRNARESLAAITEAGLTGPGVFVNGAIVSDMPTSRSLTCQTLPPELAEEVIEFFGRLGHAVLVLADDPDTGQPVYIQTAHASPHQATVEWLIANRMQAMVQEVIEPQYRGRIVRLGIVVNVPEALQIEQALAVKFGERVFSYSIYAAVYDCQVIEAFGRKTTKWSGIQRLCRLLGVDPARAVAIGDDVNDIPMLQEAALSFAMGNASPAVQTYAKRITRPQQESGVARVIEGILSGEW